MRNVEEFKADPYLATVTNCMLWVFYGMPSVHPNSILVITINGIGLVFEAIYLTIYFLFASRKQRLRMLAILGIEFVAMAIIVGVVITQAHTYTARTRIVGILCIIFGSAMYASPLTVMKKVITTKSVKYMPFFLSLTNFLNGICWTLYALIKFDLNMVIPNGLGAFFGAVQLILFECFYRTTVWDEEDDDKAKSEIQNFALFLFLLLLRKGGHSHSHNHPMEKMAVAGLILVPALSPCATTLPVFLAVGNSSSMMVLAIIVLLIRE